MTQIFLSLSFVDVSFVRLVYDRLPRGVARYFEKSFETGEDLIAAMERGMDASELFVLFASSAALASFAVRFEIDEARRKAVFGKLKKILVFPIEAGLVFSDLPKWMQNCWIPNAGYTAPDIARYLTTVLLEPDRGLSIAAPNVLGRGATVDIVRRLAALHLQKHKANPRVFVFAGITGIGRRTFAAYYLRNALGANANLPFGPTITLSAQAELTDLYRAIRIEIDARIPKDVLADDQQAFNALDEDGKIAEIMRVMRHFMVLEQAVTIVSAAGFFEDAANPKSWVAKFLKAVPAEQILVVISNLQFRSEFVDELGVVIQHRVEELHDEDIRALMIFTSDLLKLDGFAISDKLVAAIGGHPDVANAAVRLAKQKGAAILERDPRQLFGIQRAIIGDAVRPELIGRTERPILDILSWLPNLGSDLLEKIVVVELSHPPEDFGRAIEQLILGCLIYATGYSLSIAASVRQLYRRYNVTDQKTLKAMAAVFEREWRENSDQGFRDDLFSAFVFMNVLEGKALPPELRKLLTPNNLYDVVRDAYARGKSTEDPATIAQAIEWGKLAFEMSMAESLREEILSTVARAQIRLDRHSDAERTIEVMRSRHYRQVAFLEGHSLRRRRRFEQAIPKLKFVLENNRGNRAAVHELAICYRRLRRTKELETLLKEHGHLIEDSAEFLDFSIGLNIARNNLNSVTADIERLRILDDDSNRADLRHAQLLSKRGNDKAAFEYLSDALKESGRGSTRLRSARAHYATRCGKTKEAREELALMKSIQRNEARLVNLESEILVAEGRFREALDFNRKLTPQEPGDWYVRAAILDALGNDPKTGLVEATALRKEAEGIRAKYARDNDFFFDE